MAEEGAGENFKDENQNDDQVVVEDEGERENFNEENQNVQLVVDDEGERANFNEENFNEVNRNESADGRYTEAPQPTDSQVATHPLL